MIWPRFLRSAARKEPISAFLVIAGSVDVVMGGLGGYGGLVFLGLFAVSGALAWRWLVWQRWQRQHPPEKIAQYALPPQSARALPMLSMHKNYPPR